jgi:hypothetical protein
MQRRHLHPDDRPRSGATVQSRANGRFRSVRANGAASRSGGRIFEERGTTAATTDAIAERAGVSIGRLPVLPEQGRAVRDASGHCSAQAGLEPGVGLLARACCERDPGSSAR